MLVCLVMQCSEHCPMFCASILLPCLSSCRLATQRRPTCSYHLRVHIRSLVSTASTASATEAPLLALTRLELDAQVDDDTCMSAIVPGGQQGAVVLGVNFMRRSFTVFQ